MTRKLQEIGLETAHQLVDFSGTQRAWAGIKDPLNVAQAHVKEQLEGAVAIHNILVREKVAYLADEVGMGKTYVALGVVGLFRHFNPGWRVLYIAPRENIQRKWHKEILNFTANNWRVTDNRVRSFQGTPAYGLTLCRNLLDLTRQVTVDPHRDFLTRMTSFSLPLSTTNSRQWANKRQALQREIPWLNLRAFSLRDKEQFKNAYARAINAVLPHFDLVVIDEGHNLKHGLQGSAARNRLIAQILGHPDFADPRFPNYGRRFERALVLSATPLESDYQELWNQLHLLDQHHNWPVLKETDSDQVTEREQQEAASRFLVRRLTGLRISDEKYTKNMYRREWRNGGVISHDQPLPVADERQRLIVALVQKKVAEVIGSERFKNSFQIGMLASFESFLETAKVADDSANFDGSDQTTEQLEKEGVDTPSINRLAESYRKKFGEALPHPKMDAVAESLKENFGSGEKVLIFVRRVRSVDELAEKLNRYYDRWLKNYLLSWSEAQPQIQQQIEGAFQEYDAHRLRRHPRSYNTPADEDIVSDEEDLIYKDTADKGDDDNFFAWFFRGEGPAGFFSGASFNRNRLTSEGSAYSTFFEDNYLTWLLESPDDPVQTIAGLRQTSFEVTERLLRRTAYAIFRQSSRQRRFPRLRVFWAYQQAALYLLEQTQDAELAEKARIIRRERYSGGPLDGLRIIPNNFPAPESYLTTQTFFTELMKRDQLRDKLWPEEPHDDFVAYFRRREQRRELLLAAARLGHPLVELWLAAVHRLGTISAGAQDRSEDRAEALINDYLDLLSSQQQGDTTYTAYHELVKIAGNFDLILAVNFPTIRDEPLPGLSKLFGAALGRQTPVAGMWGGVNQSLVRQFRMPGYPLILVTTDVLQEGEDLHTFCRQVMHYGISWTPSSMEQRTGRVDRIRSLTQRRLDNQPSITGEEKLQVYYPHLQETIERVQVERVYERMNRFIRLMHKSFGGEQLNESRVDVNQEMVSRRKDIAPIDDRLVTVFPVKETWLHPEWPPVPIKAKGEMDRILNHFNQMMAALRKNFKIEIESEHAAGSFFATVFVLSDGALAGPGSSVEARHQPFALFLRTATGDGRVLLRCVSPIGVVSRHDDLAIERVCEAQQRLGFGKICAIDDKKMDTYDLTAEADILFHPLTTQASEVIDLVIRTTHCADHMEQTLLQGRDEPMATFRTELTEEPERG